MDLAQFRQDLLGKGLELRALPEEIGFVRGKVVDEHDQFFFALPVVLQEVIVFLEAFQPVLFEPARKPALEQKFGAIVKVNPAVAVDKVPEKPEDVIGQRNDLLFEHYLPRASFAACRTVLSGSSSASFARSASTAAVPFCLTASIAALRTLQCGSVSRAATVL